MENKRRLSSPETTTPNTRKRRLIVSPEKDPFDVLRACKKLLSELLTNPKHASYAGIFAQPVDVDAYGIPDYYDVIKEPMDLSTMMTKLEEGKYKDEDDLAFDARLIAHNCVKYNGSDHPISIPCNRLLEAFECGFSKIKKLKERSAVSIFDKLDQKEKEIRQKISTHQEMLDDLNYQLQCVNEQRIREKELREKPKIEKKKKMPKEPKLSQMEDVAIIESSDEDDTAASMSIEELTYLSQELNKLESIHCLKVIEIINKFEKKNVGDPTQEEIEIEFDQLKPKTLRELEKFLQALKKPKPKPRANRGKVMQLPSDPSELSKQEKQLKERLENIEHALDIKKKPKPESSSSSSSSSSSDDDSSSSSSGPSSDTLCSETETDK